MKLKWLENSNKPLGLEYFFWMGEDERNLIRSWHSKVEGKTKNQNFFINEVAHALTKIRYDYKIATIEPSIDFRGRIYYKKESPVRDCIRGKEWLKKGKEFSPLHKSELATLSELYLWYAYRIAKGELSLEKLCNDSGFFAHEVRETFWSPRIVKYDNVADDYLAICDGGTMKYVVCVHDKHYGTGVVVLKDNLYTTV